MTSAREDLEWLLFCDQPERYRERDALLDRLASELDAARNPWRPASEWMEEMGEHVDYCTRIWIDQKVWSPWMRQIPVPGASIKRRNDTTEMQHRIARLPPLPKNEP